MDRLTAAYADGIRVAADNGGCRNIQIVADPIQPGNLAGLSYGINIMITFETGRSGATTFLCVYKDGEYLGDIHRTWEGALCYTTVEGVTFNLKAYRFDNATTEVIEMIS